MLAGQHCSRDGGQKILRAATNLAVAAPGIAEALLATACSLIAAIPAVVIYNVFARVVAGYRLLLDDLATAVLALASRDLDRAAPRPILLRNAAE